MSWRIFTPQLTSTPPPPLLPQTPRPSSPLNPPYPHLVNLKVPPPPHCPLMSDDALGNTVRLRIWQQNLNTSLIAQLSLLNSPTIVDWDILVIQEPHINFLRNTSANHHWHVLYPSQHLTHPQQRTRAVILISTKLDMNSWTQLTLPSSDVVAIQLSGAFGRCTLFNIYNDGNHANTLTTLDNFLELNNTSIRSSATDHVLWMGDFNRHHPLWEDIRNRHLFNYAAANPLIDLIAEHSMVQLLPCGIPTLQASSTGNWTRPDNVFGTEHLLDAVVSCDTAPDLRGPKTDHLPILLTLDLVVPQTTPELRRNWREVDWDAFKMHLQTAITIKPAIPLASDDEFQQAARHLTNAITSAMDACVPFSKPCPHSKRWWTKRLTDLRQRIRDLDKLAYQMRAVPTHAVHTDLKQTKQLYADEITATKKQHWVEWLEDIEGNDLWTANRYISSAPSDGGKTRVPTLRTTRPDGTVAEAATNSAKSAILATSFFPPPPANDLLPQDTIYPDPVARMPTITTDQIKRAIVKLSGYKAPGPDGVCNIVFKECSEILVPYLLHLFSAAFSHQTFYQPWREFTTIVLRKPGKPNYGIPKAYRPIALLNTTGKLLTAVVADQLTYVLEHHHLLPNTHFGGRPGRSTTDSLHLLEETVKNAWRSHKVASVLFLDIEGAFPNAVTTRLIHNMRMRRIPREIVQFTERLLTHRQTQLKFDGFTSDWFPVTNGIGQGDPLSMILYIIYSSGLVDVATPRGNRRALKELTLAFVDDTAFIAIGNTFTETHAILADMLERPGGGYDWSRAHNSRFETNKFALMDFSMNRLKPRPNMHIQGAVIRPVQTHRFLGVILDQELRWKAQVDNAIARGLSYVMQLRRLSASAKGLPMHLMRQLYLAVAVPKMLYAADLWFSPVFHTGSNTLQRGSIGVAKRLTSIQRLAAIAITGALRTTATDTLEAHAHLLPTTLLLQNACFRSIVRLTAHPSSHPLFIPIRKAAGRYVASHRTSLHRLTRRFGLHPDTVETLIPARRPPSTRNTWTSHIAATKDDAIKECEQLTDLIQIYSDGSGFKGRIGAAAILFRVGQQPRTLRFHLGSEEEHTVFEAEEVGLTLAAHLIATEPNLIFPTSILVDNQATILAGESFYSRPGSYLADHFRRIMQRTAREHDGFNVTLRWVPGHSNMHGNEEADKHAKAASEGHHNDSPTHLLPRYLRHRTLPLSISALIESQVKSTAERWKHLWSTSPRFRHINRIDPHILRKSFVKLSATFSKRLTSLYLFLRTGHAPLNKHLHRIQKSASPSCPHCPNTDETVHHYLLACPHYRKERHLLTAALGRDASSIQFLLSTPEATPHLVTYINATGRMKAVLGVVPLPNVPTD